MNRLIFEGRFLVNMTGSIVRQDALRPVHGRLDWERMYRTADYHRIANIIYLGILGNGEHVQERWQEHFFERYQEALLFGDGCTNAEIEILTLLDMGEVPCIMLASCDIRDLYQIPEAAANSPLKLYFDSESYLLAKGYLVDLGYETDRFYPGFGERMKRVSGFHVEIYHKLPFITRLYEMQALNLLGHATVRNAYQYVRALSLEDRFIFRLVTAAHHYVTDELIIRELLDIYLYYKSWQEQMNVEYIMQRLSAFHIDGLAEKLVQISGMWFGSKEEGVFGELPEDMEVFDVLENRILSRGEIAKETDAQAICLARLIRQAKDRDKRRRKIEKTRKRIGEYLGTLKRRIRWVLPEHQYMCALYPTLEKLPILLPICWLRRGLRLILGILTRRGSQF